MWRTLATIALAAVMVPAPASAKTPIDGLWRSPDGRTGAYMHVRVQPCRNGGVERCAIVTGVFDGGKPEAIGRTVMRGMEPRPDGTWSGGKVIQPLKGEVYNSSIRPAGMNRMEVEGCLIGSFLCRSQTWTRVN